MRLVTTRFHIQYHREGVSFFPVAVPKYRVTKVLKHTTYLDIGLTIS